MSYFYYSKLQTMIYSIMKKNNYRPLRTCIVMTEKVVLRDAQIVFKKNHPKIREQNGTFF